MEYAREQNDGEELGFYLFISISVLNMKVLYF
jgi:hypothetical protein